MSKIDEKNSEVTKAGIKNRGSPVKSSKKPVMKGPNNVKKMLGYFNVTALYLTIVVGLIINWEPVYVNLAWPCSFIYLFQMFLITFDKVE